MNISRMFFICESSFFNNDCNICFPFYLYNNLRYLIELVKVIVPHGTPVIQYISR